MGAGSELQRPLALAVIWGLALSTPVTLFVVPTLLVAFRGRGYKLERAPAHGCGSASRRSSSSPVIPTSHPDLEYPAHLEVRRVSRNGGIRWHNHWVNVSHVLAEEYVAFEEIDDGVWTVYFGPLALGRFDERRLVIEDLHGYTSRNARRV